MSGQQQSPVDLGDTIHTDFGRRGLKIHWRRPQGTIVTGPHGKLRVEFNGRQSDYISLEGSEYHLEGFHFHFPSEHWVEDRQQRMELHMVHRSTNRNSGQRTVLGVFLEEEKKKVAPKGSAGSQAPPCVSTNPRDWLPSNITEYYRYEGSLTTKPFTENVHWVVFRRPFVCPRPLFALLRKDYCESARLPQPLNRRFILANFR